MTESLGKAVLAELGIDNKNIDKIKDVPYRELYAACQRAMGKSIGTRKPGTPMMWGFGPTPDGEVLMQQPFQPGFASFSDSKPIIIGTTFNELQRLTYNQPLTMNDARKALQPTFGERTEEYIKAFGGLGRDILHKTFCPLTIFSVQRLLSRLTISLHAARHRRICICLRGSHL